MPLLGVYIKAILIEVDRADLAMLYLRVRSVFTNP